MPKSTSFKNAQLTTEIGGTNAIGLSSTLPTAAGTNVTEPSGNGYARTSITTWGAVSGGSVATNANVSLAASTGAWLAGAAMPYWVIYDAVSAGTMRRYGALTSGNAINFDETGINATTNRITATAHGLVDSDRVYYDIRTGSTAAGGLTPGIGTLYFVKRIDANTFELYTDAGLTSIVDITSVGLGTQFVQKVTPITVGAAGVTVTFPSGQITLTEAD